MTVPPLSFRRSLLLSIGVPVFAGLAWATDVFVVDSNFRAAGSELYRSGQLREDQWQSSFDEVHYRSVLNLQGAKPGTRWYAVETKFAADHGLERYDYGLSAHVAPSIDQMQDLVDIMRKAPKPLLIHCKNGADRTGLVSALYRLAIEGQTQDVAARQLSLWYGHFPWFGSRSEAMDKAFARFSASTTAQAVASAQPDRPF